MYILDYKSVNELSRTPFPTRNIEPGTGIDLIRKFCETNCDPIPEGLEYGADSVEDQKILERMYDRIETKKEVKATIVSIAVLIETLEDMFIPVQKNDENPSGHDLRAAIDEPVIIEVSKAAKIPVGFKLDMTLLESTVNEMTQGLLSIDATIRPRSSLCDKGVYVMLATIDVDFQGVPKVHLINLGSEPFIVQPNERIGQLVFGVRLNNEKISWKKTRSEEFAPTKRGENGFGSSGRF